MQRGTEVDRSVGSFGSDRTEHLVFLDLSGVTTVWLCSCTGFEYIFFFQFHMNIHEIGCTHPYRKIYNLYFVHHPSTFPVNRKLSFNTRSGFFVDNNEKIFYSLSRFIFTIIDNCTESFSPGRAAPWMFERVRGKNHGYGPTTFIKTTCKPRSQRHSVLHHTPLEICLSYNRGCTKIWRVAGSVPQQHLNT